MLSTFLKIMNRERTLSFSAAICLLTVSAVALPGVFQEDDPFENTNLWEGVEPVEPLTSNLTIEPALDGDASPGELVGDLGFDDPATMDQVPDLGLDLKLEQEPMAESFVSEQSSPDFETDPGQLDIEPGGLSDVHLETPDLETEVAEIDTKELTLGELNGDGEILEDETDSFLESPEVASSVSDQEFETAPGSMADDPNSNSETQVTQDLEPPTTQAQDETDETVYQGEFWVAPAAPELTPDSVPIPLIPQDDGTDNGQDSLTLQPDALEGDVLEGDSFTEAPQFEPLPAQPFPEFDWSQAAPRQVNPSEVPNNVAISPAEPMAPLFSSPQIVPEGYQAFAAGNPALGGAVELNPMQSFPLPRTVIWNDNPDFVLDVPDDGSVPVENPSSPMFSVVQEPSQQIESHAEPSYAGAYDAYQPVCEACNAGQGPAITPNEVPAISNYGWGEPQPVTPVTSCAPTSSRCRLLSCFGGVLSRVRIFRFRSFKLCPFKRVKVCRNQCGRKRVTRGLLKNWFNRPPFERKMATGLFSRPVPNPAQGHRGLLFRRSAPPTRGLLSGFFRGGNSSS